ncbi:hypothetical protein [Helicobacter rodentium]|uniref:hypothetical protein n=1 Tax=Helicobacter rodentium TaxID=59617 RepID=UPI0025A570D0|nr:hypothetical protein [Helicobacter rodentium]
MTEKQTSQIRFYIMDLHSNSPNLAQMPCICTPQNCANFLQCAYHKTQKSILPRRH